MSAPRTCALLSVGLVLGCIDPIAQEVIGFGDGFWPCLRALGNRFGSTCFEWKCSVFGWLCFWGLGHLAWFGLGCHGRRRNDFAKDLVIQMIRDALCFRLLAYG